MRPTPVFASALIGCWLLVSHSAPAAACDDRDDDDDDDDSEVITARADADFAPSAPMAERDERIQRVIERLHRRLERTERLLERRAADARLEGDEDDGRLDVHFDFDVNVDFGAATDDDDDD